MPQPEAEDNLQRTTQIGPTVYDQTLEVTVFLLLIVPSMFISLLAVRQGNLSFSLTAVATLFRDLALLCLVLFFLRHNHETVGLIGWTPRRWLKDIILGIVLYVPFLFVVSLVEQLLDFLGLSTPATPLPSGLSAAGAGEYVLGVVLVLVVAVTEETIFRGYLNLRFNNVMGNLRAAVLLSSIIFAIGHGYEGTIGVITVGVMGAIFSIVYIWRGSLVTPITLHFLQDFIGIVLIPILKQ